MLGHNFLNGSCTRCSEPEKHFDFYGTTMTLGGTLDMNFLVLSTQLQAGTSYYAVVTKQYADGTEASVQIPMEQWQSIDVNGAPYLYYFTYTGMNAKEMTDNVTAVIYSDGIQVSLSKTDSIRDYAMRALANTTDAATITMLVEMLNYGAAAQVHFENYHADDLANSQLTDQQKAYAMGEITLTSRQQAGDFYYGTALSLRNEIRLAFIFKDAYLDNTMNALITYTDHYGNPKQLMITGDKFEYLMPDQKQYGYVTVEGIAVADCRQMVTCTIFDADGNILYTVSDCAESYAARSGEAVNLAAMKFSDAAYAYFHP